MISFFAFVAIINFLAYLDFTTVVIHLSETDITINVTIVYYIFHANNLYGIVDFSKYTRWKLTSSY